MERKKGKKLKGRRWGRRVRCGGKSEGGLRGKKWEGDVMRVKLRDWKKRKEEGGK